MEISHECPHWTYIGPPHRWSPSLHFEQATSFILVVEEKYYFGRIEHRIVVQIARRQVESIRVMIDWIPRFV